MDEAKEFMNALREVGIEVTPTRAKFLKKLINDLRENIKENALEHRDDYESLRNMSLLLKQQYCKEFAEKGVEVTPQEIDDLSSLIIQIYDEEKMF